MPVVIEKQDPDAFEQAEAEENVVLHRDLLTFFLVGAGPTCARCAARRYFVRTSYGPNSSGSIRLPRIVF